MNRWGWLLAVLVGAMGPVNAQNFDFYQQGPYRAEVPNPSQITGYEPGQFQTPHAQVLQVVQKIAETSDRVKVLPIGQTWERRGLYLAVISAPENLARIPEIQANLARLADPRKTTLEQATQISRVTPAVVWLNFGIHGNESASYETVQQVVYQLAASQDPQTLKILKDVVVVINVMHNPDGHERFAVWENSVAMGDPEPFSLEHEEPYQVYGRGNHYRFDMNRDMLALTQPENHAIARELLRWRPQVFADFHGQVKSYFFPPAAEPVNKNLVLKQTLFWNDRFGKANAQAFDRYGWEYYVRDIFDLHYAGYMDSWSSLNGATGMTYETDGGGPRSLVIRREDDSLLTFRQGIAKHYVAALATLETAQANREDRLKDYYAFFKTGLEQANQGTLRRVILTNKDPEKTAGVVKALVRLGIEVGRTQESFRATVQDYAGSGSAAREFAPGSYIVDLQQPQKRLAQAILESDPQLDPGFIQQELERLNRNLAKGSKVPKEDYGFYDITAWSLPMASGIESYWTSDTAPVARTAVSLDAQGQLNPASMSTPFSRANTAYLIPAGSQGSQRLVIALFKAGFKISVATRSMNAEGQTWPPGTWVVPVARNSETLHSQIRDLALGTKVISVNTAYTATGAAGIGSETVQALQAPKVAVVWDEATDPTSYGALWYGFEQVYGLPFTVLSARGLQGSTLKRFNVLILPAGSGYAKALNKDTVATLKDWIQNGGTLITLGEATTWAATKEVNFTSIRPVGEAEESKDPPVKLKPLSIPGAAFRAKLDPNSFLSYGYANQILIVLKTGDHFWQRSKEGANVITFTAPPPLRVAGFVWPDNTEQLLKGTVHLVTEPLGDGQVILFAEDPNFRYLWRTTAEAFMNGVLLGPTLR